ncbi:winged helix-turn-helix domain-containing protein [Bacillus sp. 165]|uniref:ArsR/SmtB family transcription factor n=1 Tax=Bacillus sp. 165 TaxID=1529117 RepID=UPI001ADB84E3|nr:winged helix-turn-helix transcriptional regulator [Bacillus sp. 165]
MGENELVISADQQKLIANALRIKIVHLLQAEALTAKQVAVRLNKTPGSVHYHIQLLYKGGIIDLVETKENSGIIEKYYKAKATRFVVQQEKRNNAFNANVATHLMLSESERQQFLWELEQLLLRWENMDQSDNIVRTEYSVSCGIKKEMEYDK